MMIGSIFRGFVPVLCVVLSFGCATGGHENRDEPIDYQDVVNGIVTDARLRTAAIDAWPRKVRGVLREYYERYPGLYNVQWMDADGITQCGYPQKRSLRGYDHRSGLQPEDGWLLTVMESADVQFRSGRMPGGFEGELYAAPVRTGGRRFGMVYAVRRMDER